MGNLCRSPLAEGVFKHLAEQAGLDEHFHVESAGMGAWHVGESPDARAQRTARAHGVRLDGAAQQFRPGDFARFDHVLALDEDIAASLRRLASEAPARQKIRLLRDYDALARNGDHDVPDPYYGGPEEFERAYQMVERSCRALFDELKTRV